MICVLLMLLKVKLTRQFINSKGWGLIMFNFNEGILRKRYKSIKFEHQAH